MSGDCLGVPEQGNVVRGRIKSGAEMDSERREGTAYEYLCHLEEAKNWIEDCIKEKYQLLRNKRNIFAMAYTMLNLVIFVHLRL